MSVDEASGFPAGTLVHTSDGLKRIEEIRSGDLVLSYPDDQIPPQRIRQKDEYIHRQVTAIFVHEDAAVCELTAWDLANNIKEVIKLTPQHPMYVKGQGWRPAGPLKFGDVLLCEEFSNLLVKKKASVALERMRVYNLEVDDFHTFYVGELGVWVHNWNV